MRFFPAARKDDALKHDEETQHGAVGHFLPPGLIERTESDDLLDGRQDHGAEKGADYVAYASGQQCAADDGGGNGIHFAAHGHAGVSGWQM